MRIGLALPHYDFSLPGDGPISFEAVAEVAVRAEALGFDSVWVSDHFFASLARFGGPDEPRGSLEPLTTLAGLAVRTERVRLGTLVASAPFRHPGILAKSVTTIDLLSGGRFDLGIGAGWYRDEFEAFGYGFGSVGDRFDLLEETVAALDALLPGGPVDVDGRFVRLRGAYNHPVPAQRPRPPIWIGAKGGDRALRLAARHADGWNTAWRWTEQAYSDRVRRAREVCEEVGRDPSTLRLSLGLYTILGENPSDLVTRWHRIQAWMPGRALDLEMVDAFAVDTLTGTPEQVLDKLGRFAELGVEEVILGLAPVWFSIPDPSMLDLFAETVLPEAHRL